MRAISLVQKLEFEFSGNIARNAVTLGDLDNDGCNELVIGNDEGVIAIFKGKEKIQTITGLTFVACVEIGDIRNEGKNSLVIVTADGWCHIYEVHSQEEESTSDEAEINESVDEVDGQGPSSAAATTETQSSSESTLDSDLKNTKVLKTPLVCVHIQRIPANIKNLLLGDVDSDGQIEVVVGLTDRVIRSYRFVKNPCKTTNDFFKENAKPEEKFLGKLVAINKWECANQIGSITLHHSYNGRPSILVGQPGGTFMRIRCQMDEGEEELNRSDGSNNGNLPGSIDYQFLGISRMRNPNISTEILGDLKSYASAESVGKIGESTNISPPYALATLDGTIMLVQDEVILWAIAVDHQVFALTKLDVTRNGSDDIVVCSWDGQTYILDQSKNSVRFHLEEPVRAFQSGWYYLNPDQPSVTALVYVTFKNTIIIYYDIPLKNLICKKFEPDEATLSQLFVDKSRNPEQALEYVKNMDKKSKAELVSSLLYDD
ncbi:unnamed protein product [Ceutorhynchus assimilis]|uniref:Integrin-alpha FG-GAP repeat-containing protein 2 n=1 Tax=Ceutorhynchus assimilis TaxID=467358 RepID=A0A9N9MP79_9CUCU|nr:unnamed protein product [Ceutorhynchus assimilis]